MTQFFAWKIKLPNLDWTFYVIWINLFLMKHKLINFNWIVNDLIFRILLINYLNSIKESIQRQLLIEQAFFKIGVLKNFAIFRGKHLCWSLFLIKLRACNFPVNTAEFLRKSCFHKTSLVTTSEKLINFPGKHHWRRWNIFIFLIKTTE